MTTATPTFSTHALARARAAFDARPQRQVNATLVKAWTGCTAAAAQALIDHLVEQGELEPVGDDVNFRAVTSDADASPEPDPEPSAAAIRPGKIHVSLIRTDGGTQPRAGLDPATIADYADGYKSGDKFPPVELVYDGAIYWLWDGYHRLGAKQEADGVDTTIDANVRQGTQRDAVLFSLAANATHGLRRTNADKRRAVMVMLEDAEWSQLPDREIARRCKVTHPFVGKLRAELNPPPGGNGYHPAPSQPPARRWRHAGARWRAKPDLAQVRAMILAFVDERPPATLYGTIRHALIDDQAVPPARFDIALAALVDDGTLIAGPGKDYRRAPIDQINPLTAEVTPDEPGTFDYMPPGQLWRFALTDDQAPASPADNTPDGEALLYARHGPRWKNHVVHEYSDLLDSVRDSAPTETAPAADESSDEMTTAAREDAAPGRALRDTVAIARDAFAEVVMRHKRWVSLREMMKWGDIRDYDIAQQALDAMLENKTLAMQYHKGWRCFVYQDPDFEDYELTTAIGLTVTALLENLESLQNAAAEVHDFDPRVGMEHGHLLTAEERHTLRATLTATRSAMEQASATLLIIAAELDRIDADHTPAA